MPQVSEVLGSHSRYQARPAPQSTFQVPRFGSRNEASIEQAASGERMKKAALRHPKLRRLAHLLGCSRVAAIGHLELFWSWVADYAPSGDLTPFHPTEFVPECDWTADPDAFLTALVESGWVDWDGEGTRVHDWLEHRPSWVDAKLKNTGKGSKASKPAPTAATVEPATAPTTEPTVEAPTEASSYASLPSPSIPPSGKRAGKPARAPDPCFEAINAACGLDYQRLTDTERGKANKALSLIRKAEPDLTPAMLHAAARKWAQVFPGAECTPTALSGNWGKVKPNRPKLAPAADPQQAEAMRVSDLLNDAESLRRLCAAKGRECPPRSADESPETFHARCKAAFQGEVA